MGAAAAALLLAACGSGSDAQTLPAAAGDPAVQVISADPELRDRVAELLPGLAARAGLDLVRPVRVEWRTRAELEAYLRAQVDKELPAAEARDIVASYALLGLVEPDLQLRELLMALYLEQVAGFYDPDSMALWVMEDQAEQDLQAVLLHELVHAVQDQAVSLDAITHDSLGSDRRTAAQAAIEGHATLVMLEETLERMQGRPVDLSELPDLAGSIRPALEATRAQYPALAQAPRIIQEGLLFPYIEGAGFVLEVWRDRGGRPAPFGALLPVSTEQVLHPDRALGASRDDPTWVDVVGPEARFEDELGEAGLRVFLNGVVGPEAEDLARGWDGDRFWLYGAGSSGETLRWILVFDDTAARDGFTAAVERSAWARGQAVAFHAREDGGTPSLWVEIGGPPPVDFRTPQ